MLHELIFLRSHLQFRSYSYLVVFARGGLHVKTQMGMLVHFFGFEIWADPVFFWGVSKTGPTFLGYVKLRPQEHFFTRDCNVIFRNYCVAIARKICNPATPVLGVRAKFADR